MNTILKLATSEEDIQFLYCTRTDPLVDKMLSGSAPINFEQHKNYINKVQGISRWIYIYFDSGIRVGYSQIYDVRENQLEVGFAVSPKYQGMGFGKDLVKKTVEKAEEIFPGKKVVLFVKINNDRAIHVYEKLNFKKIKITNDLLYMEKQ